MSNQLEFILNISDEKCFEEVLNTYDLYVRIIRFIKQL